jgi:hypothetical protein
MDSLLLLLLLQLACAASIIVITALKLHNFNITWDKSSWNSNVNNTCLLGTMSNGANLCYFAYMAGGISVVATGALSILQCCTCHLCGLGTILDAVFAAAGTFLWAVAGIIFNNYGKAPAMANAPLPEWRMSITILSFAACALFGVMALAAVYGMLSACCCSCCGGGSRTKTVYRDVEYGKGQGQFMAR